MFEGVALMNLVTSGPIDASTMMICHDKMSEAEFQTFLDIGTKYYATPDDNIISAQMPKKINEKIRRRIQNWRRLDQFENNDSMASSEWK